MNKDEYLRLMKQAIDESIKEDEKIQQFLVWLHEKIASLGSPYQESALRAFYCEVVECKIVEGITSVNRETSRMLDSNLDKDIDEVRGIANQLENLIEDRFFAKAIHRIFYIHNSEPARHLIEKVKILPAIDIVIDRHLAIVYKKAGGENIFIWENNYLPIAISLLVGKSKLKFRSELKSLIDNSWMFRHYQHKNRENEKKRLNYLLVQHRNLKLDWQFSDEQKQLLNKYYAANKLLVDLLQENHASPEVQKEIQDTLLLPIIEIERRKSGITKKLLLDRPQESNDTLEVKETQEILLLPKVEIEKCMNNEVQPQIQNMLRLPTDKIAQHKLENNKRGLKISINADFYTTTLLYFSLLIVLILSIVFITVFRHYIWIL